MITKISVSENILLTVAAVIAVRKLMRSSWVQKYGALAVDELRNPEQLRQKIVDALPALESAAHSINRFIPQVQGAVSGVQNTVSNIANQIPSQESQSPSLDQGFAYPKTGTAPNLHSKSTQNDLQQRDFASQNLTSNQDRQSETQSAAVGSDSSLNRMPSGLGSKDNSSMPRL